MPRRPRGVYVRDTPDWFLQKCGSVGGIVTVISPPVPVLDLYNNANDGRNLHVYKIWVGAQGYGPYAIKRLRGHGANSIKDAEPIIIGTAPLPGQLYWDSIAAEQTWVNGAPGNGFNYGNAYAIDAPGNTVDSWEAPGPIVVIPPGFSVRVYYPINFGTGTVATLSASFFFAALPDQG